MRSAHRTQRVVVIGSELDPLPEAVGPPTRQVDACPLCRSPLHTTLARKAPYELRRCGACRLAYVTPRPSSESPTAAVTGRPRQVRGQRAVTEQLTWVLGDAPGRGRALLAGDGAGGSCRALLDQRGFDVDPGGLEVLTDAQRDAATRYELICLWEVIAEVPDPVGLLLGARRRLAPDGQLVIHTADLDSVVTRLRGRRRLHDRHPERLQHFNAATLGRLLDRTGFAPERSTRRHPGRRLDPHDELTVVASVRPERGDPR